MSLILDALRKADAERERGAVPGLHAQPVPPASADAPAAPPGRPVLWTVIGAVVGLGVAVGTVFYMRETPAPVAPSASTAPPDSAAVAAAAGAAPATSNPTPAPSTREPAAPAAEPAPWPQPDARRPAEAVRAADAKAAPAEPPVYAREQLPPHIRATLPELSFGGSIFSGNAANRSLIVNGRLHREGEEVSPGLTLEQIRRNGAVFSIRGYRFEVPL